MSKYSNEFKMKVIVIDELRHEFKLEALLKYAEITRSTFYYQLNS